MDYPQALGASLSHLAAVGTACGSSGEQLEDELAKCINMFSISSPFGLMLHVR